jgi:DNA-binding transcriptional regulator YiaG
MAQIFKDHRKTLIERQNSARGFAPKTLDRTGRFNGKVNFLRVQNAAESIGLSKRHACNVLRVSVSTMYRWEHGLSPMEEWYVEVMEDLAKNFIYVYSCKHPKKSISALRKPWVSGWKGNGDNRWWTKNSLSRHPKDNKLGDILQAVDQALPPVAEE